MRDLLLEGHGRAVPRIFDLRWNLVWHRARPRSVLARVFENAEPVEARSLNEFKQRLEFFITFAGKTDDKCRPERDARDSGPQPFNQAFDMGP